MYEEVKELLIDNIDPNLKTISIVLFYIVYKDGVKFAESQGPRRAFVPGQIDEVAEWVGGCADAQLTLNLCNGMWTPEVIAAYQERLNAAE